MYSNKRIIPFLLVVAAVMLCDMPFSDIYRDGKSTWAQERGNSRPEQGQAGPRRGGRRGGPRGSPGPQYEPTEEEIDTIMEGLQQRDPNRAKELSEIRETDPEQFINELRRYAGPEYNNLIGRRIEMFRGRRQTEFLEWLEDYAPKDANDLAVLRETDPELYARRYDFIWRRYDQIFEQSRTNPELAEVLVADLELEERQRALTTEIRDTQDEEERSKFMSQLQAVVSERYDFIVIRKELEYKELLRRLEDLQKQVEASLEDIEVWRDEDFKKQEIENQVQFLTERRGRRGVFGGRPPR